MKKHGDNPVNQSKLDVITRSRHQARENVQAWDMIGFGFTSDWLKKWRENFEPITEWSNAKPMQFANYFRQPTENRSFRHQKLINYWIAKALMIRYILCKISIFQSIIAQRLQSTPDNSNFQIKLKKVRVIGSWKQRSGNKEKTVFTVFLLIQYTFQSSEDGTVHFFRNQNVT